MFLLTSCHNACFSSKNQAFKVALFCENRAKRGQIKKIRPLLLSKNFELQERKWPYFFDFRPLRHRNGNKGQNQGHSSRAFMYGLLIDFLTSKWHFGIIYVSKKFHEFSWPLSAPKGWCAVCWQKGHLIFPAFFHLSASISLCRWLKFWNFLFYSGYGCKFPQLKVAWYNIL